MTTIAPTFLPSGASDANVSIAPRGATRAPTPQSGAVALIGLALAALAVLWFVLVAALFHKLGSAWPAAVVGSSLLEGKYAM